MAVEWVVMEFIHDWLQRGYPSGSSASVFPTEDEAHEYAQRIRKLYPATFCRVFSREALPIKEPPIQTFPLKVDWSRPVLPYRK